MIFKSVKYMLIVTSLLFFGGCLNFMGDAGKPFLSNEEQNIISEILKENGINAGKDVFDYLVIDYTEFTNHETSYEIIIDNPNISTIVLSTTINKLKNSKFFQGINFAYGIGMSIDSVEIRTDSVIILPFLGLSQCNLTHLPTEIGKIRTKKLDISDNHLTTLPLEIMNILNEPKPFKATSISMDGLLHDSLPDTLLTWFDEVYSKQDFSK